MKFKYYLESISGIEIYPMISLIIFVVFFFLVSVWVMRMKKEEINLFENLPFGDKPKNNNSSETDKN